VLCTTVDHVLLTDKSSDLIEQFKGWFWLLVERMSNKERQDLVSYGPLMFLNYK